LKLFQVCRLRNLPIVTFINKLDREGRDPLDLLDEIEKVLGIPTTPVSWPIGQGSEFQGVYDRWVKELLLYPRGDDPTNRDRPKVQLSSTDDPKLLETIGERARQQLLDELSLLDSAGTPWDREAFLAGRLSPVFFGSALNDFGVEPFLARFLELSPSP